MLKEEANNLRGVIDILHLKHKEYADRIQTYISSHSVDQSEMTRLTGFLDIQTFLFIKNRYLNFFYIQ